MKKTWILLVVVALSLFISPIHSVAAQENSPITITKQFEVSAVKNSNADESKDYTVTVTGTIKNNSTETISDVKIYLDVSTAFAGLKDTLVITIDGEILPNQIRNINVTEDLSEKFAKVNKVSVTVDGSARFDLTTGANKTNLEYESPDVWFSVTLLAVFAGLFVVAILRNKKYKYKG